MNEERGAIKGAPDIRGQRLGDYIAIEPTDERTKKSVVWRFRCAKCGAERLISLKNFRKCTGERTRCDKCRTPELDDTALAFLFASSSYMGDKLIMRNDDPFIVDYVYAITGGSRGVSDKGSPLLRIPLSARREIEKRGIVCGRMTRGRELPAYEDAEDFIAAYIQVHYSIQARYLKSMHGIPCFRFSVYGCRAVVNLANSVLAGVIDAPLKAVQVSHKANMESIIFQSKDHITQIVRWVEAGICSPAFKARAEEVLSSGARAAQKGKDDE